MLARLVTQAITTGPSAEQLAVLQLGELTDLDAIRRPRLTARESANLEHYIATTSERARRGGETPRCGSTGPLRVAECPNRPAPDCGPRELSGDAGGQSRTLRACGEASARPPLTETAAACDPRNRRPCSVVATVRFAVTEKSRRPRDLPSAPSEGRR